MIRSRLFRTMAVLLPLGLMLGCEKGPFLVSSVAVEKVTVAPRLITVVEDENVVLSVEALDDKGFKVTNQLVTWTSEDVATATIAGNGTGATLTGVREGLTRILVNVGEVTEFVNVRVNPGPRIAVSSSAITITAGVGTTPSIQTFDVRNDGNGTLQWSASDNQSWLSVSPSSGSLEPKEAQTVQVVAEGTQPLGLHSATITVQGEQTLQVNVTLSVINSAFNIDVRFLGDAPSTTNRLAFDNAVAFWSSAIIGDLADVQATLAGGQCGSDNWPALDEVIDDLVIFAEFKAIDGAGGILAQASPCFVRDSNTLPVLGLMTFDVDDANSLAARGLLENTIAHEMGHVLGFGTIWSSKGLLEQPSDTAHGGTLNADTHFTGVQARAAFDLIGPTYVGARVPVENDTGRWGSGSLDSHWREDVFDTELMTPGINSGVNNPASRMTIASLADIGYVVDLDAAENYALPGAAAVDGAPSVIEVLLDDIRRGPIWILGSNGVPNGVLRQ